MAAGRANPSQRRRVVGSSDDMFRISFEQVGTKQRRLMWPCSQKATYTTRTNYMLSGHRGLLSRLVRLRSRAAGGAYRPAPVRGRRGAEVVLSISLILYPVVGCRPRARESCACARARASAARLSRTARIFRDMLVLGTFGGGLILGLVGLSSEVTARVAQKFGHTGNRPRRSSVQKSYCWPNPT